MAEEQEADLRVSRRRSAPETAPPGPRSPRRSRVWLRRLLLYVAVPVFGLFALSLVLGAFLPVPSTLMLGRWLAGDSVERVWQPLERFSPALRLAVIAAEDQRYCGHWGVDFEALRVVLNSEGGPSRGASTLSMQVAKNLYLWPGRSYVRKAMEIPLALVLDLVWGKRRMLEIYLNIAEWGEGIFGAEAAARYYFNTSAARLDAVAAARMVAALPNPITRDAAGRSSHSKRLHGRLQGIGPLAHCVLD